MPAPDTASGTGVETPTAGRADDGLANDEDESIAWLDYTFVVDDGQYWE